MTTATQTNYTPSPYAYHVPAPRIACPECRGIGAMWAAGDLRPRRCEVCNGHGKVTARAALAKVAP